MVEVSMKTIDFNFVADIYDSYVTVDFDLDFFSRLLKERPGKCLELMCGTGRVSIPLLRQGFNLACVDYSEEMLKIFSQKAEALNITPRIVCQDICQLDLKEQFDCIFIPFNSFAEICDSGKQEEALVRIYSHLEDKGVFICTLYNPQYRMRTADGQLRVLGNFDLAPNRSLVITYYNQFNNQTNKVTGIQFYEIYDEHNKLLDKRFLNIAFALLNKEGFSRMAGKAGFEVEAVYGDYNFSPFNQDSMFMNFILKKRF